MSSNKRAFDSLFIWNSKQNRFVLREESNWDLSQSRIPFRGIITERISAYVAEKIEIPLSVLDISCWEIWNMDFSFYGQVR